MKESYSIGIFSDEENFVNAVKSLLESKFIIHEVFTPYPVNEIFHLLKRRSRLPAAAYFSGLFGAAATLAFLYYTSVVDWPIMYGGKPFNSFPSFIVITIVLTILTVTIASLAFFSARSKLLPGRENTVFHPGATDDRFVIVVRNDPGDPDSLSASSGLMEDKGAEEVIIRDYEKVRI